MRALLARHLRSMALQAQTYGIAAVFVLISGVLFINLVSTAAVADLGPYYASIANVFLVLCPILAARHLGEERSSGRLAVTLAWPVSRTAVVASTFVAITAYTWLLAAIAWLYHVQLAGFAEPDLARTLGGYLGLLLVTAMFNAIGLAVAARSGSVAGGAFLGFGLLLVLWIVQFLPESLRARVDGFGPLSHLDPMIRGVIYWADVAYFVVLTATALALAVAALRRRRVGTGRPVVLRRLALGGAAAAVFVATPDAAQAVGGSYDLTPDHRQTVSETTREVIQALSNRRDAAGNEVETAITVTAFATPLSAEAGALRAAVDKYAAAGADITGALVDPESAPALARSTGPDGAPGYLVELQIATRTPFGIRTRGADRPVDELSEVTLTSAIARMSRIDPPTVCFTTGHGERRTTDPGAEGLTSLSARLRVIGYDIDDVALATADPDDALAGCRVVAIMGPQVGFGESELAMMRRYLDEGRLLIAADPVRGQAAIAGLNEMIAAWGGRFLPGTVRDPQSLAGDRAAVVCSRYPSRSDVVAELSAEDASVLFSNVAAIEAQPAAGPQDDPRFVPLVNSSPGSYVVSGSTGGEDTGGGFTGGEDAGGGSTGGEDAGPRRTGEHTVAALLDAGRAADSGAFDDRDQTRIALLGSSEVAANRYQRDFGNQELVVKAVQWADAADTLVSAFHEVGQRPGLNVTEAQRQTLIRQTVVLPALAALVFVPFVLWRLRRG